MGLYSRLSDLIASNVYALLDRAENPEWMIAHVVREMEEGLSTAKRHASMAIAAERRIAREMEQLQTGSAFWHGKAREALAAGQEDLARRALARKLEHDDRRKGLEAHQSAAVETGENIRTALRALEARVAEARRKQRTLLARSRAARAQAELQRLAGRTLPGPDTALAKFERLEDRIADVEDRLLAAAEIDQPGGALEGDFLELEQARRIDEELAALRPGTSS